MGKHYTEIDDKLADFLLRQHVFFVATAPSGEDGHVNVSPKGLPSLCLLGPREVAYVDYAGSGVETIAHLRQNGRITLMFCAFDGPPKIVRLHGHGTAVEPQDEVFAALLPRFLPVMPPRSIIRVAVERITDSCGYGVPRYDFVGERDQLAAWGARKGEEGLFHYQREKNGRSIDGLPGLSWVEPPG